MGDVGATVRLAWETRAPGRHCALHLCRLVGECTPSLHGAKTSSVLAARRSPQLQATAHAPLVSSGGHQPHHCHPEHAHHTPCCPQAAAPQQHLHRAATPAAWDSRSRSTAGPQSRRCSQARTSQKLVSARSVHSAPRASAPACGTPHTSQNSPQRLGDAAYGGPMQSHPKRGACAVSWCTLGAGMVSLVSPWLVPGGGSVATEAAHALTVSRRCGGPSRNWTRLTGTGAGVGGLVPGNGAHCGPLRPHVPLHAAGTDRAPSRRPQHRT